MKKLFAVLLTLAMLLGLAACNTSGGGKPSIVGTWEGSMDISAALEMALQTEIEDSISCKMIYIFREDGTLSSSVDEDSLNDMLDAMVDVIVDMLATMYGEEFDLDAMLAEEDMTREEFTQQLLDTANLEDMIEQAAEGGYYKYENGRIYSAEDREDLEGDLTNIACMVVTLSGDTLTVTDIEQDGEKLSELMPGLFPMVFTKQ